MNYVSFKTRGALTDEHAKIYVRRKAEDDAVFHLRKMDYLLITEPHQQGKTSLINYLMRHPALNEVVFAYVDITPFNCSTEATWYQALCPSILRKLRGFIPCDQWPTIPQNSIGWRDFLLNVAASATDVHRRVVIVLDEIGTVKIPGATKFFGVLRAVYNSRQSYPEFKQLAFVLIGVFLLRDLNQDYKTSSPFNIAHRLRLPDFTLAQVSELVSKGRWSDEQADALAQRIHYWTDGQPYLTQLLCSYLGPDATPADVDAGVERLRREDVIHLPSLLEQFNSDEKLCQYVHRIQAGERIKFNPHRHHAQLELLGVVKVNAKGYCIIRNRIYEEALSSFLETPSPVLQVPPISSTSYKERTVEWKDSNTMDPEQFIDQKDAKDLFQVLMKFASKFQAAGDRQDILSGSGIDSSFISSLKFGTSFVFANSLLARFREYRVSERRLDYHPMVAFLSYLLDTGPTNYGLEDQDIDLCTQLAERGEENFRACRARSAVGRIESPPGTGIGTGVLVSKNLLLTCRHVFSKHHVQQAWVRFGYKAGSYELKKDVFELNLNFVSAHNHPDYALVRINGQPQQQVAKPVDKVLSGGLDIRVIHHPQGHHVVISGVGQIVQVGEDYIDHNISTDEGSSGAPIFDEAWELIAIHRGRPGLGRDVSPGTTEGLPIRAIWDRISLHLT